MQGCNVRLGIPALDLHARLAVLGVSWLSLSCRQPSRTRDSLVPERDKIVIMHQEHRMSSHGGRACSCQHDAGLLRLRIQQYSTGWFAADRRRPAF